MHLARLTVRDFRNLRDVLLEPHPRFTILAGANGAGKTNLLESIYLLANVRGFRNAKNADMVRLGRDGALIEALTETGAQAERTLRTTLQLELGPRSRRFKVNGKPVRSFADYLGTMTAVVFTPADLLLLQGGAGERRRFVDRVSCMAMPSQLGDLQDYEKALRARNALLKDARPDLALLEAYTDQLVPLGARVIQRRCEVIAAMRPLLEATFADIFGAHLPLEMTYDCRWLPSGEQLAGDEASVAAQLGEVLAAKRGAELRSGHTMAGPHRDDLSFVLDGMPAREFASQGQTRAVVLALKMSEIRFISERRGDRPILLLDDVSSELDERRNAQLFAYIRGNDGQTVITTTSRDYIRIDADFRCYRVADGDIDLHSEG